jgi:hypothetical protein
MAGSAQGGRSRGQEVGASAVSLCTWEGRRNSRDLRADFAYFTIVQFFRQRKKTT